MKVGSLFSGIGGFDLGLERAGFTIEWQVEIDDYCRRVLQKHWPSVPCHYDITTIDWHWIPRVDLVCGGFPCQPFSCAGKQRGKDDDRYLWPEVVRCLSELKPTWFIGENVPGLLHLGVEQVLADLAALGYETQILGIPACGVDAPHIRQRLWILSHATSIRCESDGGMDNGQYARQEATRPHLTASGDVMANPISTDGGRQRGISELATDEGRRTVATGTTSLQSRHGQTCPENAESGSQDVADAEECRLERSGNESDCDTERGRQIEFVGSRDAGGAEIMADRLKPEQRRAARVRGRQRECEETQGNGGRGNGETNGLWLPEPSVGRVAHGIPHRVDRLKGLGNAVVPAIVETLGRMILDVEQAYKNETDSAQR